MTDSRTGPDVLRKALLWGSVAFLGVGLVLPLAELAAKSLSNADGEYVGFTNFAAFFGNPSLSRALWNSLYISVVATAIAMPPAFLFAYAITRTRMPLKSLFRQLVMLPLYAPTMLVGIALVYLFGKKGLITTGFFDLVPMLAADIGLYGPTGIILSEAILAVFASAGLASLVRSWPYRLELGLRHYDFSNYGGGGYASFRNSLVMAVASALFGTALTFGSAFLIEKTRGSRALRRIASFLSLVPLTLPGLVIGLSYIFLFNSPGLEIAGFYFVSSMTTVSAVIFLYTPDTALASAAVVNMDDAGDTAAAAAMGMLIVLANIVVKFGFEHASRWAAKRGQNWRKR